MRSGQFIALFALLGVGSVVGIACSSTTSEDVPTCDPGPCVDDETGSETSTTGDGDVDATTDSTTDSTVDSTVVDGPVGDGFTVLPDGAIALPDGAILLPDGAILTDAPIPCIPGATQCTDCKDNDGDGKTDWLDPECTGPLDNDESSFATGIPGDNVDCKQDCFFDGNSGGGDDGCVWATKCLVGYTPSAGSKCAAYDPVAAMDPKICPKPTDKCLKNCRPYVPKGCDCAGCCQVFDPAGVPHTVRLVDTCNTASLSDPTKCPTCTIIADCSNPCGKCDWCLGKTSLPADCYPPPPPPDAGPDAPMTDAPMSDAPTVDAPPPSTCPDGLQMCSPTVACPLGYYCLTGCCIKPPS